ncbi:MAG: hypothetical protein CM15mP100_1040 [Alphaproteobacteria bacterium]|nr:MAG: hypothetical protein CM15mP100_1040 [Alphaproteobacteria bacterium]
MRSRTSFLLFYLTRQARDSDSTVSQDPVCGTGQKDYAAPARHFKPGPARHFHYAFKSAHLSQWQEAAHILGQVNRDGRGIAGVEKSMEDKLAAGHKISLSIDLGIRQLSGALWPNRLKPSKPLAEQAWSLKSKQAKSLPLHLCQIMTPIAMLLLRQRPCLIRPPRACLKWAAFSKSLIRQLPWRWALLV